MFLSARSFPTTSSCVTTGFLGLIFFAYALVSAHSFYAMGQLLSLGAAFGIGCWVRDAKPLWLVFAIALSLNLLLSLAYSDLNILINGERNWGIWGNPNIFGVALALGLAGAIAYCIWWFIPVAALGIAWTQSRGALLAAGGIGLICLWRYSRFYAMLVLLLAALLAVAASGDRGIGMWMRLGIWNDTMTHLTWLGHGWGSFMDEWWTWPLHTNTGPLSVPSHAYNDFLELIFDLGLGSILGWAFLLACLEGDHPQARLVCLAFALTALTFFPLSIPPCGQLFALSLGQLWRTTWPAGNC